MTEKTSAQARLHDRHLWRLARAAAVVESGKVLLAAPLASDAFRLLAAFLVAGCPGSGSHRWDMENDISPS